MQRKSTDKQDVSQKLIRVIPDKFFYSLWIDANEIEEEEFLLKYLSKDYCSKYSIPSKHFYNLLIQIYSYAHLTLYQIIEKSGFSKLEIRNRYCFPNRTFNAWYYNQNDCPAYTRLFLLKNLKLFKLVHHIYTESDFPGYRTKNPNSALPEEFQEHQDPIPDTNHEDDYFTDDFSFKLWEQEHVKHYNNDVQRLLKSLEYLDR